MPFSLLTAVNPGTQRDAAPSSIAGPVHPIPPGSAGSARSRLFSAMPSSDTTPLAAAPSGPAASAPSPPDPTRPVDVLTVASVTDVTASVRRIVLSGTPAAVAAAGPTISLLVPRVGDPAPRWPSVQRDGRIVWPEGEDLFAWVAAESAAVRAVRGDLRGRWRLGRAQHHAIGYWRRGRAMGG